MLSYATFALLLAGAMSQPMMTTMMQGFMGMGPMMSTMTPPGPCCTPPQWQGVLMDLKSQYDVVSTVVYDSMKKVEGVWTTMRSTGQVVAHALIDYNTQMMYEAEYIPGQAPNCKKSDFKVPMFRCMNDSHIMNKQYIGSSTLGLKGMGIDYDSYSYKAADTEFTVALGTVPGTTDVCYPVLESVKNDNMDALYMFLQLTATIETPEVASMPAPCVGQNAAVVG